MTDLPAGRELDAAVAKVLGVEPSCDCNMPCFERGDNVYCCACAAKMAPEYSTDPADAIEALEAWCNLGGGVGNRFSIDRNFGRGYTVSVYTRDNVVYASAPTLAHAAAKALVTASAATP